LIELVDEKSRELGEVRSLDELVVGAVLRLAEAASKGDIRACQWIVDRFYPRESEPPIRCRRFPSPSQKPLEFLDALARAVADSELTTGQAAKLAHLARPFVIDAELKQLAEQFAHLQRKLAQIDTTQLQAVE
jgi:hypothetical protein